MGESRVHMYTIGSLYSADVRILINTFELVNGGSASGLDSVGERSPIAPGISTSTSSRVQVRSAGISS